MKRWTVMGLLLGMLAGAWAQAPAEEGIAILTNLAYKAGPRLTTYERERCKLDLYLPKGKTDFPTLVWFHGGALTGGAKDDGTTVAVAKAFARNGVAVAVANYRLNNRVRYPAYVADAAAAVAWVNRHIAKQHGSPRKVFIGGHSAGAYLAAMVGMDPRWLKALGLSTKEIAGVIPVSGQMLTHFTIRQERGVPNPQTTPTLDEAGPCYHVRKDAPPILCICGGNDWPARAEENRYFIAVLKTTGHATGAYQEFAGRDHGTILSLLAQQDDPEMAAILDFIAMYSPKTVEAGSK